MNISKFVIVIATADNGEVLTRTLKTIEQDVIPHELEQIIISDNHPSASAKDAVSAFKDRLPISYHHHDVPTKCSSLNNSVNMLSDDVFVIFFDDDVRLEKGCLNAYVDTVKSATSPIFIGGRCSVDYEQEPPEWLIPYLPSSATGWTLGNEVTPLSKPKALGYNWGARVKDIIRCGGFDENIGPGTSNPLGDEMYMQQSLLDAGVSGLFVPKARVYHYVPEQKCSQDWALSRASLRGYSDGLKIVKQKQGLLKSDGENIKSVNVILFKYLAAKSISLLFPKEIFGRFVFPFHFYSNFFKSCLIAVNEAKEAVPMHGSTVTNSSIN